MTELNSLSIATKCVNVSLTTFSEIILKANKLSSSKFSNVFSAILQDQNVAIKTFEKSRYDNARREYTILSTCHHKNIVSLIGAGPDIPSDCRYLLFEYADCFSLDEDVFQWLAQVCRAGDYLHCSYYPPIIHCDIKPSNILVFNKGTTVKLSDFGSAYQLESVENPQTGTLYYMAPEILMVRNGCQIPYSEKSDIYSLSILLWELLARRRPSEFLKPNALYEAFWSTIRKRPPSLKGCPKPLLNVIETCWHFNPEYRPRMLDVLRIFEVYISKLSNSTLARLNIELSSLGH